MGVVVCNDWESPNGHDNPDTHTYIHYMIMVIMHVYMPHVHVPHIT